MDISYLELRYSGSSAIAPGAPTSIGGVINSMLVGSQSASAVAALAGVTPKFLSGHSTANTSNLVIRFVDAANTLAVGRAVPGTFGDPVVVSGDGSYRLVAPDGGAVHVDVITANLPVGDFDGTYVVADVLQGMYDDVSKAESFAGMTDYRCFYLKNTHSTDSFFGVKVYVSGVPTGGDAVYIGAAPEGVGDGTTTGVAEVVANELTPPASVSFYSALSAGAAVSLAGTLGPGQCVAFWVRRIVPAETAVGSIADVCSFTVVAGI